MSAQKDILWIFFAQFIKQGKRSVLGMFERFFKEIQNSTFPPKGACPVTKGKGHRKKILRPRGFLNYFHSQTSPQRCSKKEGGCTHISPVVSFCRPVSPKFSVATHMVGFQFTVCTPDFQFTFTFLMSHFKDCQFPFSPNKGGGSKLLSLPSSILFPYEKIVILPPISCWISPWCFHFLFALGDKVWVEATARF